MASLLQDIWGSFRSLPFWVQIWMSCFLFPANVAAFVVYGLTQHITTFWIMLASTIVLLTGTPMLIYQRGFSRILALPHIVWVPLVIYLIYQLATNGSQIQQESTTAFYYAAIVTTLNSVSLDFDFLDAYRWLKGDRHVFGPVQLVHRHDNHDQQLEPSNRDDKQNVDH